MKTIRTLDRHLTPMGAWAFSVGTSVGWGSLVVTASTYLVQAGPAGSVLGLAVGAVIMLNNHVYMNKRSQESERLANIDPMTGVKSKHAYMVSEAELNGAISEERAGEFSVVVCDVNGLKRSTTPWGTRPATPTSARPAPWSATSSSTAPSTAWAATSSWCCSGAGTMRSAGS